MALSFTDEQIQEKAEQLGVVDAGTPLPRSQRSRVVAALAADQKQPSAAAPPSPRLAREVVVQPGGDIRVDGAPFPWLVARERLDVTVNPDGVSTVRLTLLAESVQITPPARSESENRA